MGEGTKDRFSISVIVPTIGRPDSLRELLESLSAQTRKVDEVIVADCSSDSETALIVNDLRWHRSGLLVRSIRVDLPHAVRQRRAAIGISQGEFLLLLDDDVVLETDCVEQMFKTFKEYPDTVGVFADFSNQCWPQPTFLWKLYLRLFHGLREGEWNGRVLGPLLRFGYNPIPASPQPMEWLGSGNSMVRRAAYLSAGGFSDFFLHRCTINEDVDLGIKLSRVGMILFCPAARMAHHHAPGGRVSIAVGTEDDVYNRFVVMHQTLKFSRLHSLFLVIVYISLESFSNVLGAIKRARVGTTFQLFRGRLSGLVRIGWMCFASKGSDCT